MGRIWRVADVGCNLPRAHDAWGAGHYLHSGKIPDAWSMAARGSWVESKKSEEDVKAAWGSWERVVKAIYLMYIS